jgi:hypothetical protein
MFERSDLAALVAYEGRHPVVSLYLHLDPQLRGTPEAYRARLKGLLKQGNGHAPQHDIEAIERFFEKDFDWTGRGVAVFSSLGDDFWSVHRFAVPLRSHIHVGQKPFIMPLADLLDTYGSYTVAGLDQQSLRLYHFHLGDVVATTRVDGEEIRSVKAASGNRQAGHVKGQEPAAHKKEIVRANLKKFADALEAFARHNKAESLILGGTAENTHLFREMLPAAWRDRLQGELSVPLTASEKEVRDRSLEVLQAAQRERQEKLVQNIQVAARKSANGAIRLTARPSARRQSRRSLIEGLQAPGFQCTGCGYVSSSRYEAACPFCGSAFRQIQNAAELAVRRVVDQGGKIEFLEEDSALAEAGGIGALLRY